MLRNSAEVCNGQPCPSRRFTIPSRGNRCLNHQHDKSPPERCLPSPDRSNASRKGLDMPRMAIFLLFCRSAILCGRAAPASIRPAGDRNIGRGSALVAVPKNSATSRTVTRFARNASSHHLSTHGRARTSNAQCRAMRAVQLQRGLGICLGRPGCRRSPFPPAGAREFPAS